MKYFYLITGSSPLQMSVEAHRESVRLVWAQSQLWCLRHCLLMLPRSQLGVVCWVLRDNHIALAGSRGALGGVRIHSSALAEH